MREITVDGKTYKVTAIPPSLTPYARLLSKKLKQEPETIEDADCNKQTIEKCLDKLMPELCTPKPEPGHLPKVWEAICIETNRLGLNAKKFRGPKQPNDAESRVDGANTGRETKHTVKPEGF